MIKKEQMVGTRLPKPLIDDIERIEQIEQIDRSSAVRKLLYHAVEAWKLEHYAQNYGQGKISLARAAEESGVSVWEMMEYVRQKKIPAQYSLEDLEHDLKLISKRLDKKLPSVK